MISPQPAGDARRAGRRGEAKERGADLRTAPHSEAEVLNEVLVLSNGPLTHWMIDVIYGELMRGNFRLEQPLQIGFLGAEGSHSHVAASGRFGAALNQAEGHCRQELTVLGSYPRGERILR